MPLIVTRGLGSQGDGTQSALLTTQGYGTPGTQDFLACKAFSVIGVDVFTTYVDVIFNNLPSVSGPSALPANWVIQSLNGGAAVSVIAVQTLTNRVRLTVTEQTQGKSYQLSIPYTGLIDQFLNVFDGPFTLNFTGVGIIPTAILARSIDARTVQVVFDVPVLAADATNPANYSISPTLTVTNVIQISPTVFQLTTAKQTIAQVYVVTVSGIHDADGNLI